MKLELQRQEFMKSWQLVTKFTDQFVRFEATEFGVMLEASNLRSSVKNHALGVNVLETGNALIPIKLFGDILKKANEDTLFLDVSSSRGMLKSGRNKMRFPVGSEFPQLPKSEGADYICEISASSLANLINEGTVAASQPQDFPKYLGTCLVKTEDNYLLAASTDGKRLAVGKTPCQEIISIGEEMLVLASDLKEIGKTLTADKNVKIYSDASTIYFQLEDVEFSLRKIDASFPQYNRILNDEVYTTLKIQTSDILSALERVNIIAKTNPAHIMAMILNQNELRITARSAEHGVVKEILYGEISENSLTVGFNVDFFIDGIKALGDCEAVVEFSGEETQARIKRNGDNSFLYMLMPARLAALDSLTDEEMEDLNDNA